MPVGEVMTRFTVAADYVKINWKGFFYKVLKLGRSLTTYFPFLMECL